MISDIRIIQITGVHGQISSCWWWYISILVDNVLWIYYFKIVILSAITWGEYYFDCFIIYFDNCIWWRSGLKISNSTYSFLIFIFIINTLIIVIFLKQSSSAGLNSKRIIKISIYINIWIKIDKHVRLTIHCCYIGVES